MVRVKRTNLSGRNWIKRLFYAGKTSLTLEDKLFIKGLVLEEKDFTVDHDAALLKKMEPSTHCPSGCTSTKMLLSGLSSSPTLRVL